MHDWPFKRLEALTDHRSIAKALNEEGLTAAQRNCLGSNLEKASETVREDNRLRARARRERQRQHQSALPQTLPAKRPEALADVTNQPKRSKREESGKKLVCGVMNLVKVMGVKQVLLMVDYWRSVGTPEDGQGDGHVHIRLEAGADLGLVQNGPILRYRINIGGITYANTVCQVVMAETLIQIHGLTDSASDIEKLAGLVEGRDGSHLCHCNSGRPCVSRHHIINDDTTTHRKRKGCNKGCRCDNVVRCFTYSWGEE